MKNKYEFGSGRIKIIYDTENMRLFIKKSLFANCILFQRQRYIYGKWITTIGLAAREGDKETPETVTEFFNKAEEKELKKIGLCLLPIKP